MIQFAKFLQLLGLMILPVALVVVTLPSIPRAGEMEFAILILGIATFALGRVLEKKYVP